MEDECDRCGEFGPGRQRWMFYSRFEWLRGTAIRHEFFCERCLRNMRVYSIIGMSIFGLVICAIFGVLIWLWLKP